MSKSTWCFSLILLSVNAYAGSCASLLQDSVNWLKASTLNRISFVMSQTRAPAKFLGYSTGLFDKVVPGIPPIYGASITASNIPSLFSDRAWCPGWSPGSFCILNQPFDYRAPDKIDLNIYSVYNLVTGKTSEELQIKLISWGGAIYSLPLQCSSGFWYGFLNEPSGNSIVTLSFNKITLLAPPK